MKKEIAIGIALVGIICIALFSGCIRETPKTEYIPSPTPTPTPTPDIRNIVVTAEDLNYEVWVNGKGGPYAQARYLTLTNNGDVRIHLGVYCVAPDILGHVSCGPNTGDITIEPHTTRVWEIGCNCVNGVGRKNIAGDYSTIARVELITDSYSARYGKGKIIAEFPVHIKVHDLTDTKDI